MRCSPGVEVRVGSRKGAAAHLMEVGLVAPRQALALPEHLLSLGKGWARKLPWRLEVQVDRAPGRGWCRGGRGCPGGRSRGR